jgi:hypothetical protein
VSLSLINVEEGSFLLYTYSYIFLLYSGLFILKWIIFFFTIFILSILEGLAFKVGEIRYLFLLIHYRFMQHIQCIYHILRYVIYSIKECLFKTTKAYNALYRIYLFKASKIFSFMIVPPFILLSYQNLFLLLR